MTIEQAAILAAELEQQCIEQLEALRAAASGSSISTDDRIKYGARRVRIQKICGLLQASGIGSFEGDSASHSVPSAIHSGSRITRRSEGRQHAS
jgi:hypothetical protein